VIDAAAIVIAVSPLLIGGTTFALVSWTLRFARRVAAQLPT